MGDDPQHPALVMAARMRRREVPISPMHLYYASLQEPVDAGAKPDDALYEHACHHAGMFGTHKPDGTPCTFKGCARTRLSCSTPSHHIAETVCPVCGEDLTK